MGVFEQRGGAGGGRRLWDGDCGLGGEGGRDLEDGLVVCEDAGGEEEGGHALGWCCGCRLRVAEGLGV